MQAISFAGGEVQEYVGENVFLVQVCCHFNVTNKDCFCADKNVNEY